MKHIKVMIVDDSAVVRQVLTEMLKSDSEIQVTAAVSDPIFAMERMRVQWPDVIVLDIEMPRMDGLTFLARIMDERPTPVIICSSLTEQGAEATLKALSIGALSVVTKPSIGVKAFLHDAALELISTIKAAAGASLKRAHEPKRSVSHSAGRQGEGKKAVTARSLVAIGTSTGGTQALEHLLNALPPECPGIVIVQHMPAKFTRAFADRLNRMCVIQVKEAEPGDYVKPGQALIAPGGRHMQVSRQPRGYRVEISDGPLVNRHRPSVDVLFRSVAKSAAGSAIGVIMTGMGDDGARGLQEMRESGAHTIAQDRETSVVFGMPREAIRRGAAEAVLPLSDIADAILASA